eukprot:Skav203448  [mRNA]  locus=scaffold818:16532:17325:+ [translate_table: standard]
MLVGSSLQCLLVPRRRGQHILLTAGEINLTLPREQGELVISPQKQFLRALPFRVLKVSPRLQHPCGFLDFGVSLGRVQFQARWKSALLDTQSDIFEKPFLQPDGHLTLAVSACFGQLAAFEDRTNSILAEVPSK